MNFIKTNGINLAFFSALSALKYYDLGPAALLDPALAVSGYCLAEGLFTGKAGLYDSISSVWSDFKNKSRAAWMAWKDPHPRITPEKIARMTAEMEAVKKIDELKEKLAKLKAQIKDSKAELKEIQSLEREPSQEKLRDNKRVREVLERGPAKKASSLKSSEDKSVDVDDLAQQFIERVRAKKYFKGTGIVRSATWKPDAASSETREQLKELVGTDQGQISKAEMDAVWAEIKKEFPEF